jgi:hypothetical protein
MNTALHVVGACLYACVAVISVVMALKALGAREFLPFQAVAAGKAWDEIGAGTQAVVTSLLRLSGLGFLVVGAQLGVVAVAGILHCDLVVTVALPLLSLGFCLGLCLVNLRLHRETGAKTPWRGSLYAAIAVAIGLALSVMR